MKRQYIDVNGKVHTYIYPKQKIRYWNPLSEVMGKLRALHKKGIIQSLTEQEYSVNTSYNYIYVAFKIPRKEGE